RRRLGRTTRASRFLLQMISRQPGTSSTEIESETEAPEQSANATYLAPATVPSTEGMRGPAGPRLYVLVGIPGAGKTTYARRELGGALRVCLDDLRLMLSGKSFDLATEPAVVVAAEALRGSLAAFAASKGANLVFDATHVTQAHRRPLIATARQYGF